MGFTTGGAVDGMLNMLKNNKIIKKKILYFNDKSKAKYRNVELIFKKGSPEEIKKFNLKIRKQRKQNRIKSLFILLLSVLIFTLLFIYVFGLNLS